MDYKFNRIFLEITNVCNWNCEFCPINNIRRPKAFMNTDFAKKVITEIAANRLADEMTVHEMGEPLLHKDWDAICSFINGKGMKVWINTNGSLLDDKKIEYLANRHVGTLSLSLRTASEFSHQKRGAGNIGFDAYKSNIKKLIEVAFNARSKMDISIQLFDYFPGDGFILPDKYLVYARRKEVKDIISEFSEFCARLDPSFRQHGHGFKFYLMKNVYISRQRIMSLWTSYNEKERIYPGFFGTCNGMQKELVILSDGTVTTCCRDFDGKNALGNLNKKTLIDILDSAAARSFRDTISSHRPPTNYCRDCMGSSRLIPYIYKQTRGLLEKITNRKYYNG